MAGILNRIRLIFNKRKSLFTWSNISLRVKTNLLCFGCHFVLKRIVNDWMVGGEEKISSFRNTMLLKNHDDRLKRKMLRMMKAFRREFKRALNAFEWRKAQLVGSILLYTDFIKTTIIEGKTIDRTGLKYASNS